MKKQNDNSNNTIVELNARLNQLESYFAAMKVPIPQISTSAQPPQELTSSRSSLNASQSSTIAQVKSNTQQPVLPESFRKSVQDTSSQSSYNPSTSHSPHSKQSLSRGTLSKPLVTSSSRGNGYSNNNINLSPRHYSQNTSSHAPSSPSAVTQRPSTGSSRSLSAPSRSSSGYTSRLSSSASSNSSSNISSRPSLRSSLPKPPKYLKGNSSNPSFTATPSQLPSNFNSSNLLQHSQPNCSTSGLYPSSLSTNSSLYNNKPDTSSMYNNNTPSRFGINTTTSRSNFGTVSNPNINKTQTVVPKNPIHRTAANNSTISSARSRILQNSTTSSSFTNGTSPIASHTIAKRTVNTTYIGSTVSSTRSRLYR